MTKNNSFTPISWPRQLGEDQTHHEGLDDAPKDRLQGDHDHSLSAMSRGLTSSVSYDQGCSSFDRICQEINILLL